MKNNLIIKVLIFAGIVLTTGGCGLYSKYQRPSYGFENQAFGTIDASTDSTSSVPAWREFFTDSLLSALIDSALANNSDYQIAKLKSDEAREALTSARLSYLPSLEFSPDATYSSSGWTVQLPAQASWQIDIFGSLTNTKNQKKAQLLRSMAYVQAVKASLVATVATTYYTLAALDKEYEIYKSTMESWKENVEVTRQLMNAGQYTQAALSQAEANYYSICNSVIDIESRIASVENTLCSLLGKTPQKISRADIESWKAPEISVGGVPSDVLYARPDVRQAEEEFASAFYLTNVARSSFFPSVTISGSLDFNNMFYSAVSSLLQPIFQRGTLVAKYNIAAAQQKEAESSFRQTLIDAGIEVNNDMRSLSAARKKAGYCNMQVESLRRAVESTESMMTNGTTTYLEVLTAQQSLLSAEIGRISDKMDEISSVITLYEAIGGGCE